MQNPPIPPVKVTPEHLSQFYGFKTLVVDSGLILVGSDKTSMFSYAGNAEKLLGEGKKIVILSRGLYNPRALDLCNVLKGSGIATTEKIETRTVYDAFNRRRVSSLEIHMKPVDKKK